MVVAVSKSKAEQLELWAAARAGDRDAADLLARSVAPWLRQKAGRYARAYSLDADDVEAAGWSRFPASVKSFRPELGWSFLNYFASGAARKMLEHCRQEAARPRSVGADVLLDSQPERPDVPAESSKAAATFAGMDPLSREVVRLVTGMDGRAVDFPEAARRLGITERRCRAVYIVAAGAVRSAVLNAA